MNTTITNTTTDALPLVNFINELWKLKNLPLDSRYESLQPLIISAIQSLQKLQECVEKLPSLAQDCWFLKTQFETAQARTLDQLRVAKNSLLVLSAEASKLGDPYEILSFTIGFKAFAQCAAKTPVLFQQACPLDFILNTSDPLQEPLGDHLTSAYLDAFEL